MIARRILLKPFFEFLKKNKFNKVLEVGTGNRYRADEYEINCKKLITSSKEYNPKNTMQADACNLPFKDNEFDLVISIAMLQYIPRVWEAVNEMKRVTKEYLFVGVPFMTGKNEKESKEYWRFTQRGIREIVGLPVEFSFRVPLNIEKYYTSHFTMFKKNPRGTLPSKEDKRSTLRSKSTLQSTRR